MSRRKTVALSSRYYLQMSRRSPVESLAWFALPRPELLAIQRKSRTGLARIPPPRTVWQPDRTLLNRINIEKLRICQVRNEDFSQATFVALRNPGGGLNSPGQWLKLRFCDGTPLHHLRHRVCFRAVVIPARKRPSSRPARATSRSAAQ